MAKETKGKIVLEKIGSMEIGDTVDKKTFITALWADYDYFKARSFDVFYSKAKAQYPDRKFVTVKGVIKRLS